MNVIPGDVLARIEEFRSLSEEERNDWLRERVIDEVVGNMRMEGQPVSEEWIKKAKYEQEKYVKKGY